MLVTEKKKNGLINIIDAKKMLLNKCPFCTQELQQKK